MNGGRHTKSCRSSRHDRKQWPCRHWIGKWLKFGSRNSWRCVSIYKRRENRKRAQDSSWIMHPHSNFLVIFDVHITLYGWTLFSNKCNSNTHQNSFDSPFAFPQYRHGQLVATSAGFTVGLLERDSLSDAMERSLDFIWLFRSEKRRLSMARFVECWWRRPHWPVTKNTIICVQPAGNGSKVSR